jgi:thiol-disulfide isomerase/thioredoxin
MALSAGIAASARAQDIGIEVGSVAPAAALERLDGRAANLSEYIGKGPVVMEFWATWCPNCKELEPTFKALHEKYGKPATPGAARSTFVTFITVAVSVNQSPERAKAYVEQYKLPGEHFFDRRGNATGAYDVPATSYVVVVDRSGKVIYTGQGGKQPALEAAVRKALQ